MLDSTLYTKQTHDLGSPVPDTLKGAVTLIGGLILVVGLLNGAILLPALMAIVLLVTFTWRNEISFNLANHSYTKRQGPLGLRFGSKKTFGTPEYIAIRQKALRDGGQFVLMKSAASRTMTIALLAFTESDQLLLIMQDTDADALLAQANAIVAHYNIPLEDERA